MWLSMLMVCSEVDKSMTMESTLCVCVCVRVPFSSRSWLRRQAVSRVPLTMVSTYGRECTSNCFILIIVFILHATAI